MRNFQHTFETRKRPFISVFSICMTIPLAKIDWNDFFEKNLVLRFLGQKGPKYTQYEVF